MLKELPAQKSKLITLAIISGISFLGVFLIVRYSTTPGYVGIKILFSALTTVAIDALYLLLINQRNKGLKDTSLRKYYLSIALIAIIAYSAFLPIGYFYQDDYWCFLGTKQDNLAFGASMMRPFHVIFLDAFWFVSPSSANLIKLFSIILLIVYGLILYRWMLLSKCTSPLKAFLLTSLLLVISPLSDHIGYSSTLTLLPGFIAASLSILAFDRFCTAFQVKDKARCGAYLAMAMLCLLYSFLLYQIATAIVALLLIIKLYYDSSKREALWFALKYGLLFIAVIVLYYFVAKAIIIYTNGEAWSRGSFLSIDGIVTKLGFFFFTVVPQATDRLAISYLGALISDSENYRYVISMDEVTRIILRIVILTATLLSLLHNAFAKKAILNTIAIIVLLPISYYCFIILAEDGYLTYYAIPLISSICFIVIAGLSNFSQLASDHLREALGHSKNHRVANYVITGFLTIAIFQNYYYISNNWVANNTEKYRYIKDTISTQIEQYERIHVYGFMGEYQANVYSEMACSTALNELGYQSENYVLTASDNDYMVTVVEGSTYRSILALLTQSDITLIDRYYTYESTYDWYYWKYDDPTEEDKAALRELFVKTDLIPQAGQALIIDLRWR